MENKYNIKTNIKKLSSEQISNHMNFDKLLNDYKSTIEKNPKSLSGDNVKKINASFIKLSLIAASVLLVSLIILQMIQSTFNSSNNLIVHDYKLRPIAASLDVKFHTFKLENPNESIILEYHSGSKIKVPANAFVDKEGKSIDSEVDIEYREINSFSDKIIAGVPELSTEKEIISSYGLLEIKASSNGSAVYINPNKKLDIEFKTKVNESKIQNNLKIYNYKSKEENWNYIVENKFIIEDSIISASKENLSLKNNLRNDIEAELIDLKPKSLPIYGIQNDMQIFDIDFNIDEFPSLAAYKDELEFLAYNKDISDDFFNYEWNSMELTEIDETNFRLDLSRLEETEEISISLNVIPAINSDKIDKLEYEKRKKLYESDLAVWNKKVNELIDQRISTIENKKEYLVANTFSIRNLGLWTCGNVFKNKEDVHLFEFDNIANSGDEVKPQKIYILNSDEDIFMNMNSLGGNNFKSNILNNEGIVIAIDEKEEVYWTKIQNHQPKEALKFQKLGKLRNKEMLNEIIYA